MNTIYTIIFFMVFAVLPIILAKRKRRERDKVAREWAKVGMRRIKKHSLSLLPWNLKYEGTYDFIITKKYKEKPVHTAGSRGAPPVSSLRVETKEGKYNYDLRYIPTKEYNEYTVGDEIKCGVILHVLRGNEYYVTRQTDQRKAKMKLVMTSWVVVLSILAFTMIWLGILYFFLRTIM